MSPVDSFHDEVDRQVGDRSERRDRSFVRRALRRGVPVQDIEDRLLTATEFHRLNPERDPLAYVRSLIQEEGSNLESIHFTEVPGADASTTRNSLLPQPAGKERASESEAMARRYIHENFEATDWLAVVVRNRKSGETVQRITTAQQIASQDFQAWLRHKNAHGSDIYLSLNTLREHAHSRTKGDVKDVRHLYLDLDKEGQRKLALIYENGAVPHPNYVLQTSPEKYQVIWRVEGLAQNDAEHLLRSLARQFGGDPAATDATRVFRLPGFNNKKYAENFAVRLVAGTMPEPVYHQSDFRIEVLPHDPGTAGRIQVSAPAVLGSESVNTQSERDWAYAIRHLRRGDDPVDIVREITAYRAADRSDSEDTTKIASPRKANPRYYAEHTVARAMTHLGMTRPSDAGESRSPESEPDR
jgi:hypothetical protein